jgi:hypothetical protein
MLLSKWDTIQSTGGWTDHFPKERGDCKLRNAKGESEEAKKLFRN